MAAAAARGVVMRGRARPFAAVVVVLVAVVASASSRGAAQQRTAGAAGPLAAFTPVTDAMLANPDAADWPNWRRTLDGWGYSPLKQITTQNVHQIQLAWSWSLAAGLSQPTPLVAHGVMFVPIPGGGAQALDAATG